MLSRIPILRRFSRREPWAVGLDPWNRRLYRQVRTIPPACLEGLDAEPAHDTENAMRVRWALACKCGERQGQVLGYPLCDFNEQYDGPELFVSPVAFRCTNCDSSVDILDTAQHGYDAECKKRYGGRDYLGYRGEGDRHASVCPECDAKAHRVHASFHYAHFDIVDDEPELRPVAQEFFDSFGCFGRCGSCGHEWLIASFELA